MKRNNKGFTLAELLIVVAIIAVLVAIAIPVFTSRLEQSRETTDIANLRSAYAVAQVAAMSGDSQGKKIPDKSYWYDPNSEVGLGNSKFPMGKGTTQDGHANSSNLPNIAKYNNKSDVRDMGIKIVFENSSLSGLKFSN